MQVKKGIATQLFIEKKNDLNLYFTNLFHFCNATISH